MLLLLLVVLVLSHRVVLLLALQFAPSIGRVLFAVLFASLLRIEGDVAFGQALLQNVHRGLARGELTLVGGLQGFQLCVCG